MLLTPFYVTLVLYTNSYICLVNNDRQNYNSMRSFVQEIDKTTVIIFMILLKKRKINIKICIFSGGIQLEIIGTVLTVLKYIQTDNTLPTYMNWILHVGFRNVNVFIQYFLLHRSCALSASISWTCVWYLSMMSFSQIVYRNGR